MKTWTSSVFMRVAACSCLLVCCLPVCCLPVCCVSPAWGDDWTQWMGNRRDAVWRETGIVQQFPEKGPPVRWRTPVGPGYSGPSVADGRLFVMDRQVTKDADGNPKTEGSKLLGSERVLCLHTQTGELIWKYEYDCPYTISYPSGPRTTPLVDGDRIYALGAMGRLMALEATTGKLVWEVELAERYQADVPVWGFSTHALLDGQQLILQVGGEGSAVVALSKHDGSEIWKSLTTKEVGYAPPVMYEKEGKRQVIMWLDTAIHGLDPATGKSLWSVKFPETPPQRPVVPIMTPLIHNDTLFVSSFYDGAIALKLKSDPLGAEPLWSSDKLNDANFDESLNAIMPTPHIVDGWVYGIAGFGELRCLELKTGSVEWREVRPTGEKPAFLATAFLIRHEDRFLLFNDQGDLIIAHLTPEGYEELSRTHVIEPDGFTRGRHYVWSHPAFAEKAMFVRNDSELIRVDLNQP